MKLGGRWVCKNDLDDIREDTGVMGYGRKSNRDEGTEQEVGSVEENEKDLRERA